MAGRVYKDTSPEAEKRRARMREANRRSYLRKMGHDVPLLRARRAKMTADELAEYERNKRRLRNAKHNGLAKDGIVTPAHIQHDEPLTRYIADRMVRQEAGISTKPGFNIIGDGCFRARPHRSHT